MPMTMETLNLVAVVAHATQAVTVLCILVIQQHNNTASAFFDHGRFPLSKTVRTFKNNLVTTTQITSGTIEVPIIILFFFILSACFQGAAAFYYRGRSGYLRFVEYSLSASIMMLAISAETGITDAYFMQSAFVLTWATQILGLTAELSQTTQRPYLWVLPHCAAWVTCLSAYLPSFDAFFLSTSLSDKQPPAYVTALVVIQMILFICFGIVQALSLTQKAVWYRRLYCHQNYIIQNFTYNFDMEIERIEVATESLYIILSLVAKTSLAWIILVPALL